MNAAFRVAAALLSLAACPALAETEGGGAPAAQAALARTFVGAPFLSEAWSAAQPCSTGTTAQASVLASLEPALGSEAPVETANSLPARHGQASTVLAQAGRARGQR